MICSVKGYLQLANSVQETEIGKFSPNPLESLFLLGCDRLRRQDPIERRIQMALLTHLAPNPLPGHDF